jgi:hypothetical protein
MRALGILVLLLGACTFEPGATSSPGRDASGGGGGSTTMDGGGSGTDGGSATCPDGDGDGDCDAQDLCPGFDDHADGDHDHVPDGCDDWPCGDKPGAPDSSVTAYHNGTGFTASHIHVGGGGQLFVASANQAFDLSFGYAASTPCGHEDDCDLELQYGTDLQGAAGCAFADEVEGNYLGVGLVVSDWAGTLSLPSGRYALRLAAAAEEGCGSAWAAGTPDDDATIAIVCVP